MHWNIFDKSRYKLLKKISEVVSIDDYYMIGGTALSLQLGLRESYDFDFCVQREFNNEVLLNELESIGNAKFKACKYFRYCSNENSSNRWKRSKKRFL